MFGAIPLELLLEDNLCDSCINNKLAHNITDDSYHEKCFMRHWHVLKPLKLECEDYNQKPNTFLIPKEWNTEKAKYGFHGSEGSFYCSICGDFIMDIKDVSEVPSMTNAICNNCSEDYDINF